MYTHQFKLSGIRDPDAKINQRASTLRLYHGSPRLAGLGPGV
jgi:hypothetical protein